MEKKDLAEELKEEGYEPGIVRYENSKYRWVYELPMLKSFFLLFEVWKVLGVAYLIIILISLVINLISGGGMDGVIGTFQACTIVLVILLVLSLPAYYIVTNANNGKYTVLFEMDEEGIEHIQIKTEKAKALEALTILAGTAARNRTTVASGILSATGNSLYSDFSKVREIKTYPSKNLIRLNSTFTHNQVYVDDKDYDFVCSFIIDHCPNVTVKERK